MLNKKQLFIRYSIIFGIFAGLILLLAPKNYFPDFYNPLFLGGMAFVQIFSVLLFYPNLIFRPTYERQKETLLNLQFALTISIILNNFGALGLYQLFEIGLHYDKLVHFLNALILIITFTHFMATWFFNNTKFNKLIIYIAILFVFLGIFWEFMELFFDTFFGVKTLGLSGLYIAWDVSVDILSNVLGILAGILILMYRKNYKTAPKIE